MRIKLALPAALFVCAIAAPCAHAAPPLKPACDLLKQQTAVALYGAPLKPGVGGAGALMSTCIFSGAKGDPVGLIMMAIPPHGDANQMYQQMAHSSPKAQVDAVSGLGERADFIKDPSNPTTISLSVLSHATILSLGVEAPDNPTRRAAMVSAMKDIVAHQ
jgi:hypothetical protein